MSEPAERIRSNPHIHKQHRNRKHSMNEDFTRTLTGASLAYVGDASLEVMVRRFLVGLGICSSGKLNRLALDFVRATAQSAAVDNILPRLDERELHLQARTKRARHIHTKERVGARVPARDRLRGAVRLPRAVRQNGSGKGAVRAGIRRHDRTAQGRDARKRGRCTDRIKYSEICRRQISTETPNS